MLFIRSKVGLGVLCATLVLRATFLEHKEHKGQEKLREEEAIPILCFVLFVLFVVTPLDPLRSPG